MAGSSGVITTPTLLMASNDGDLRGFSDSESDDLNSDDDRGGDVVTVSASLPLGGGGGAVIGSFGMSLSEATFEQQQRDDDSVFGAYAEWGLDCERQREIESLRLAEDEIDSDASSDNGVTLAYLLEAIDNGIADDLAVDCVGEAVQLEEEKGKERAPAQLDDTLNSLDTDSTDVESSEEEEEQQQEQGQDDEAMKLPLAQQQQQQQDNAKRPSPPTKSSSLVRWFARRRGSSLSSSALAAKSEAADTPAPATAGVDAASPSPLARHVECIHCGLWYWSASGTTVICPDCRGERPVRNVNLSPDKELLRSGAASYWDLALAALSTWDRTDRGGFPELEQRVVHFKQIELDLPRTVPPHTRRISALRRVLQSFALYCPVIGYCQGMSYVAAFVLRALARDVDEPDYFNSSCDGLDDGNDEGDDPGLLPGGECTIQELSEGEREDEELAFWMLVSIMERYSVKALYLPGLRRLQICCYQLDALAEAFLPDLKRFFDEHSLSAILYATTWIQTIFADQRALPEPVVAAIWDVFLAALVDTPQQACPPSRQQRRQSPIDTRRVSPAEFVPLAALSPPPPPVAGAASNSPACSSATGREAATPSPLSADRNFAGVDCDSGGGDHRGSRSPSATPPLHPAEPPDATSGASSGNGAKIQPQKQQWIILFQVMLALLQRAASGMMNGPFEAALQVLRTFPADKVGELEPKALLAEAASFKITPEWLEQLENEFLSLEKAKKNHT